VEHPDLTIPGSLLPGDGRFGSGPARVRPEAVEALAAAAGTYLGTSHRRPAVTSMVRRLRTGLTDLFDLPAGYEVLLGNGGATAFWDAALFRLIDRYSAHAVFGAFSARFASIVAATPHLDDPILHRATPGDRPPFPASDGADLYALTHNETSTGVSMPVARPGPGAIVAVDATSAAGALPVDPAEFDVYYFSAQKAFGADGGLWTALCSPAALQRIEALSTRWAPPFLDLGVAVAQARRDQTPNTPPLATLFLFVNQVEHLLAEGGLAGAAARTGRSAGIVYGWAERRDYLAPFVTDRDARSSVVATIDVDDRIAVSALTGVLRANGIVDLEAYRTLGRNQIRIGMFPNVPTADLERLTAAIDWVVERL